jgi:hypothetical protein
MRTATVMDRTLAAREHRRSSGDMPCLGLDSASHIRELSARTPNHPAARQRSTHRQTPETRGAKIITHRITRALTIALTAVLSTSIAAHGGMLDATWTTPSANSDGSALNDLSSYKVYFSTSGSPCPGSSFLTKAGSRPNPRGETETLRIAGLTAGTRYFAAVTALDSLGAESPCSPVAQGVARSAVSVTPAGTTDFGSVAVNGSVDRTFTVQSTTGGSLSGTVTAQSPFSVVSGSPFNLTATNPTQNVTIRFRPTTVANATGNVNFSADGDTLVRVVTGSVTGNTADTANPTVTFATPGTAGSTVTARTSPISLGGGAADNVGVTQVSWSNDRGGSGNASGTTSWSVASVALQPGANVLTVTARDAAGNTGTARLTVTLETTTPAPTVNLTAPAANSAVSGTTTVSASTSDNTRVAGVQFMLNGTALGTERTSPPWSVSWNTRGVRNGSHTLAARARDRAGNVTTSQNVTVSVTNADPNPTPTPGPSPVPGPEPQTPPGTTAEIRYIQSRYVVTRSARSAVNVPLRRGQTAGNLNIVVVGWSGATSEPTSVTDTAGNTYQLAVGPTRAAGPQSLSQSVYYAKNIRGGGNSVTVRFSQASTADIRVAEYSGLDPANPLLATTFGTGTGNQSRTGTLIVTAPKVLLVAANVITSWTSSVTTGFTTRMVTNPDGDLVADRIVSAGSHTVSANLVDSGPWVMHLIAFQAATTNTAALNSR